MHEDCIVWMRGIQLLDNTVIGIDQAVQAASEAVCHKCRRNGATMICIVSGCKEITHWPCAIEAEWAIDEKRFQAYCPSHIDGLLYHCC